MELLHAHDLLLMAGSEEILMETLRKWRNGIKTKSFRVNACKTKVMQCRVSRLQSEDSGEHPCVVCRNAWNALGGFIKDVMAYQGKLK